LRKSERVPCIVGGSASGIADHMRVAGTQTQQSADVDARIHARQHGELLDRLDDARGTAEVVEPRIHDDPIDGVHYE
jgi:hypothetical protein